MRRHILLWLGSYIKMQENNLSLKKFIPAIVWFLIVLVLICLPGYDLPRSQDWMHKLYLDKWIHTTIFGTLALLFMFPIGRSGLPTTEKKRYFIKICISVFLWGITTELIQKYFIPGRAYEIADWTADGIGAVIAMLICRNKFSK